ncbi:unnamed protein product, partial [Mycena citricolor]
MIQLWSCLPSCYPTTSSAPPDGVITASTCPSVSDSLIFTGVSSGKPTTCPLTRGNLIVICIILGEFQRLYDMSPVDI